MKSAIIILLVILILGAGGFFWYTRYYQPSNQTANDQIVDKCAQNVALNTAEDVKAWAATDKQCRGSEATLGACEGDLIINEQDNNWRIVCTTFDGTIISIVSNQGQELGEPVFIQTN